MSRQDADFKGNLHLIVRRKRQYEKKIGGIIALRSSAGLYMQFINLCDDEKQYRRESVCVFTDGIREKGSRRRQRGRERPGWG